MSTEYHFNTVITAATDQVMQRIIDANPIIAGKAAGIARKGDNTEPAILEQLAKWNEQTAIGATPEVETALRTLVNYFQAKDSQGH